MKLSRKSFRIFIWVWFAAVVLIGILGHFQIDNSADNSAVKSLSISGWISLMLCFWTNMLLLLAQIASIVGMTMFKKWGRFLFVISGIGIIIIGLITNLIFGNEIKLTLFMQIVRDISHIVSIGTGAIICAVYLVPSIAEEFEK
jgi:hypothetical protein